MGDQAQESAKWEGETIVELKLTPQQAWPLIADFCSLDKWFTHLEKCYLVEGELGEPGMVRCCESSKFGGDGVARFAKERLISIDPSQMCLSYEVLDNNAGFKSYVSTMRLFPSDGGDDDDDDGRSGCKFVWTFEADPVEGFTLEGLCEIFKAIAHGMVIKMEEAYSQCEAN
ncbi:lachrymatory-factor synthase-like [Chenopodium quinoa]|uniref:Lachrymatory factor synthase n=1 Tax=Chenopodium quinoa TaxID=63459 RepID=A0A803N865_CHEQI|nr:lachrymatory-factor synthase-like [Chenopodium quinoa]